MALTFTSFNNFAEVEAHYNNIKPLRGKDNAGKDIRPIGDRARKWERIVKISDYCYALSDGYHMGDEHFGNYRLYGLDAEYTPTLKDMEKYAPIVWRKYRDGTEEVTLRNGWGPYQHTMRYAFLWRHTPWGLSFINRNGKHFISAGGQDYFLAKTRTVPRALYDKIQADAKQNPKSHYVAKRAKWAMAQDDKAALTFRLVDGAFKWVDGGNDIPVPPKVRVDKDLKATLKPHIEAFRDWAFAIAPMLPVRDYSYRADMRNQLIEWTDANNAELIGGWDIIYMFTAKLAREVIADDEHPMRLHLALAMTLYINGRYTKAETDAQLKAQYNRWINHQLGLNKEVKE